MTTREELVGHDFIAMSDVDLLDYCGADARKWAEAFCQIKQRKGWSADDIDEGLMTCWFANAIEHSSDVRRLASRQEVSVEELADSFPCLHRRIAEATARALLAKYSITKREG